MTDLNIEGMNIAPGVLETIVSLAARDVEGVISVGDPATSGLMSLIGGRPSTQGVEIENAENGDLNISIRLYVKSGKALPDIADDVRQAISDAVNTQVGVPVGSVDIFIDGIQFDD